MPTFSRRSVIAAAVASTPKPTFVLVPGAWHGAWAWAEVEKRLRARGFPVHALTLTGVAERSAQASPEVTLSTHVRAVAQLIEREALRDVVLVGHSYGGMVVTPLAAQLPAKPRLVVALDAFVPRSGEAMFELMKASYVEKWRARAKASGGVTVPPMLDAKSMGVPAADCARVDALLTPHPLQTFETGVAFDEAGLRSIPRLYVRCTRYPGFALWAERAAERGWRTQTIDCGHDAMLAEPERLTALLIAALH